MAKLRQKDVQDVLRLFDNELNMLGRVSKVDKMKMRRKIVNYVQPALTAATLNPEFFVAGVNEKLGDVVRQFMDPNGFSERLSKQVHTALQKTEGGSDWGATEAE